MSRLIIVSNRVAPISEGEPAAGGLAIGVYDALKETGGMWFGWSGEVVASGAPQIRIEERGPVTFATVGLSRRDYDQYYRGFSNATLWPAFHYRADLIQYDRHEFEGYGRVNVWLAQQLVPLLQDDDVIWVHDYHLIPFARALRASGVKNRIGFFLHIPFPAAQVLVNVPPHRELVESLCAFDLLGFQTEPDLRAFCDYVEFEAGGEVTRDGRTVRVSAFGSMLRAAAYPIGVYPDEIASLAQAGEHGKAARMATSLRGRQLIMSVDRLDYSKGLVERFRAFEKLLEHQASIRNRVSFLQIAPSTRADLRAYQDIRLQLEAESGRINGRYAELDWAPILYIHRQYDRQVLAALYRLARVGFVTPLRDGMNLVAKEYVSAQNPDDPGVLVLSRFAGAARELTGALIVNPIDIDGMADALSQALTMPLAERRARYADMIAQLRENNVSVWRDNFLRDLQRA
ncbi:MULTISPECIES: alpha,alpha-trehalose-phosphate synthase (UDP-forming) [Burkholderia]|jgi:trehalose 6-phosphate synthase|uniref:alpha,alpha-trehalose-phosphate synthase (UDP-forming) n=1 Tax=Burkholderia TaxID=32008 RepID=UPI00084208F2|nr:MULTISPECIES: alpha,alpha-trehalose-phosphate synthase (UDP-forming) [Burkholderia]AOK09672.1 trehalose-6-phosphate synthase [Burkholderia vietnamiensis]MCA7943086.1 alpha,alpha-trehalose-phosphate synthase (UDP-forming) [Burkholderia vietnamiensis]MCA8193932.1 alpha,alpha-trehalose-phosphate synthase (UDP-forming) [Burkholderia vietnamiensis]QTK85476.1 alpha,alpha-trehalose-phosphate synthase (UDP-forming) [Burkholderia vietnamiensis]RQM53839.1 alpha,alpha-trehalose-phosphate synthase (UDP